MRVLARKRKAWKGCNTRAKICMGAMLAPIAKLGTRCKGTKDTTCSFVKNLKISTRPEAKRWSNFFFCQSSYSDVDCFPRIKDYAMVLSHYSSILSGVEATTFSPCVELALRAVWTVDLTLCRGPRLPLKPTRTTEAWMASTPPRAHTHCRRAGASRRT